MDPAGGWLVVIATLVALATAFGARRRLPAPAVASVLAAAGAALGWGGMLLQPDPSRPEIALAVVLLAILVPSHVRIVLGPFGPGRRGA